MPQSTLSQLQIVCPFLLLLICGLVSPVLSFPSVVPARRTTTSNSNNLYMAAGEPSSTTEASSKATLTQDTLWRLRFVLRGVATAQGKKVDEIFVATGHFVEEEGYEPPQGQFVQVVASSKEGGADGDRLRLVRSRWQLSEDPDDRKDGLWVWGLFKEPLYPFLLLKLETEAVPLPSGGEEQDSDSILPLQLFAQVDHKRGEDGAVILEGSTELKVRQTETINADPFGASKVDVYEEVSIGSLSIQPMLSKSSS